MKKLISVGILLVMILCLAVPAFAEDYDFFKIDTEYTDAEKENIQSLAQGIKAAYGIEAFFLLDNSMEGGDDFIDYADRFLTASQRTTDSCIFAVSSTSYLVISRGKAKDYVSNNDADALYDSIKEFDQRGESTNAAAAYFASLYRLFDDRAKNGMPEPTTDPALNIPSEIATSRGPRLVDEANLLSASEETALQLKLDEISEQLQFDVVVVTASSIGSRTPMEFADDYYDYNGYGYGDTHDGCLLLVSMADRDWWVSTCGYGEEALDSDYFVSFIENHDVVPALSDGDYDGAFNSFADYVNEFVTEAKENKPYSYSHRYDNAKSKAIGAIISVLIGLVISGIVTLSVKSKYTKAVRMNAGAGNYLVDGSLILHQSYDNFVTTSVTKTAKETSGSSSGGSHTSSSGSSHGGGGGKF